MPGTMKKTPFGLPLGGSHSRVYSHNPVDTDGKYCGKSSVSGASRVLFAIFFMMSAGSECFEFHGFVRKYRRRLATAYARPSFSTTS